jgi:hypothetical protein
MADERTRLLARPDGPDAGYDSVQPGEPEPVADVEQQQVEDTKSYWTVVSLTRKDFGEAAFLTRETGWSIGRIGLPRRHGRDRSGFL